jgi:hypothetical protein
MEVKADTIKVVDGRLLVDVALDAGHPSAIGRTTVFFTTHGGERIDKDYTVSINLYKRA